MTHDPTPLSPPAALTCPRCGGGLADATLERCPSCDNPIGAGLFEAPGSDAHPGAHTSAHLSAHTGAHPDVSAGAGRGAMLVLGADPSHLLPMPAAEAEPAADGGACVECAGRYDGDGYCTQCGGRRPPARDHFTEAPAPWLAGVCDRGIRHAENQDAMAVRVDAAHPGRAALVVCDGVTTAVASAQASLAAAEAAAAVLTSSRAQGLGLATAREAALIARLEAAADAASDAVDQVTDTVTSARAQATGSTAGSPPPAGSTALSLPACTFVAAVIEEDLVVVGSVGDSRAYWLPEPPGVPALLTLDDSLAGEQVRAGMDRARAETGPHAHTITRWLGADAPDHTPTSRAFEPEVAGWLLLCSDGLWNYASGEQALAAVVAQVAEQVGAGPTAEAPFGDPLALAEGLVRWAKQQGGHDNITAVLARLGPVAGPDATAPVATGESASEDAVHG